MKRILMLCQCFCFGIVWCFAGSSLAGPFRNAWVCIPKINPSATELEFHIRDGGPCSDDETWGQVVKQEDGTIFLLPSEAPLPPQEQKKLEKFKKYYGIEKNR